MATPTKLIGDFLNLKRIQTPGKAGLITNQYGSILEANAESAELFNISSTAAMRNALIVSYAHRDSVMGFRKLLNQISKCDNLESNNLRMRPRGGIPFKSHIKSRVLAKANNISVIFWEIVNIDILTNPSGEWDFKLASGMK